jgi:hypothetical protein
LLSWLRLQPNELDVIQFHGLNRISLAPVGQSLFPLPNHPKPPTVFAHAANVHQFADFRSRDVSANEVN